VTTAAAHVRIPASHADLIDRPLPAVLTTHLSGGRLQSTIVWYDHDGDHLLVNTMREFQKARNLRDRPLATVLIVEPGDPNRWIEVRARVVPDGRDPCAHLDAPATGTPARARTSGGSSPSAWPRWSTRSSTG
jgi:hypothetical protein